MKKFNTKQLFPQAKLPFKASKRAILCWSLGWLVLLGLFIQIDVPDVVYKIGLSPLAQLNTIAIILYQTFAIPALILLYSLAFIRFYKLRCQDVGLIKVNTRRMYWWLAAILAYNVFTFVRLWESGNLDGNITDVTITKYLIQSIGIVIAGPIAEEIQSRGVFYTLMQSRYGPFAGWLFAAFMFGMSHTYQQNPLPAMLPGLIFGLPRLFTGNVWLSALLHSSFNAFGSIGTLFGRF